MPTTGISLVREHTEAMQLPRFLWVPFELGRPFGAPNEPAFQRRVLHAALALFDGRPGPVVLEDFPDDAPAAPASDEAWACPVSFAPVDDGRPELARRVRDEMERLAPWNELYVERRGAAPAPASGLALDEIVERLAEIAEGARRPEVDPAMPTHEWVRLGCDDLRTWYLAAAQGQPGRPGARQLRDWFWQETAAARLIGATASALLGHEDPMLRMLAGRALVPREDMAQLVPAAAPAAPTQGDASRCP